MTLNLQFQMQDIIKNREAANKKKSSANTLIIFGSIFLFIAICIIIFNLMSMYGASTNGTLNSIAGISGCCISIAALFGVLGIGFLAFGISRRVSAIGELRSVEEANQLLRNMMIAEEQKPNKPQS
jgi:hypothetical protein